MRFIWPSLDASRKLSAEEASELAARVAELTKAGLPLGEGLRALAAELPGQRLPHLLDALANRLDAGEDLAAAVDSIGSHLPPHLRGLILAGLRSGRLAEALEEYVDLERSRSDLRRRLLSSLLYPLFLLGLLTGLGILANLYIVPRFTSIYLDFKVELPLVTIWFINSSWMAPWAMIILFCLLVTAPALLAVAPRPSVLWPVLYKIPMLGPLLRWGHVAQFARLMGMMTEQQMPLPDALRLTSAGLRDANLALGCRRAADDVEKGWSLVESMSNKRQFPAGMMPLIEWGQKTPALPDAFRSIAEMFEGRIQSQGSLVEAILLPSTLFVIVTFVGVFIAAMMLPLIELIKKLS
jgi:type II secretory pathway component PulF